MVRPLTKIAKFIAEKVMRALARIPAWEVDGAIAVVVTALALGVYAFVGLGDRHHAGFEILRNIELRSLDARFEMRGPRTPDPRIVIVGTDEKTLQSYGYPIPRSAYPQLIDRLHAAGAKVVAFDIAFPRPETNSAVDALQRVKTNLQGKASPEVMQELQAAEVANNNDQHFVESLKNADNVLLSHFFLEGDRATSINGAVDEKASEEYYNVIWGQPFPQMFKRKGTGEFDLNKAWTSKSVEGPVASLVEPNYKPIAEAAKSYGFINVPLDNDGTIRRAYTLIHTHKGDEWLDWMPSMEIQTVRLFEDISDDKCAAYMAPNGLDSIEMGPHVLRPNHDGTVLINYAGPYRTYPHYSFVDVAQGKLAPELFKNKIVLVGPTAIAEGDMRNTPFPTERTGAFMGVEIHANVIDNILNSDTRGRGFLSRGFREEFIDICVILLFGVGGWLLFAKTRPLRAAIGVLAILGGFGAIAYMAFAFFGMWLYVVIPATTVVVDYAAITSYRMIFEEREKRKVRKTFERYVAPSIIKLIEDDPEKYLRTGGEMRELTIMFSDIRDFTNIAEGLTPDELVSLLNRYLGDMTDILFSTWGTLDKYIGDAIMAFWGSPFPQADHAFRSCECALKMTAHLNDLNEQLVKEGKKRLKIGIGINSGPVNVGNMGSDKRFAWTVMGDNVNLASRLEGQTKSYKVQRLLSESTYEEVKEQMICRQLDVIRVQGKQKPVAIYELLDFARNQDQYEDLLARFNAARDAYVRQAWSEAVSLFEGLLERYPDDGPSIVLLDRCREFRVAPPSGDWDGVYTTKKEPVH